jgi:translation initiation factor 2 alpha subunit (eIF-2alpha)|tara:strand:- start:4327 stop:4590 length:264 start_codon:yes stop_codon:yes gene_type:complete
MSINIKDHRNVLEGFRKEKEAKEHSQKCIEILEKELKECTKIQIRRIKMFGEEGRVFTLSQQRELLMQISGTIHKINRLIQDHSTKI